MSRMKQKNLLKKKQQNFVSKLNLIIKQEANRFRRVKKNNVQT